MPIVRRAYPAAALAWAAVLPFGTFAATRVHASTAVHFAAFAVYSIGSLVCHQRPERSFHLWAAQLPVCARCTGIYVGAAAAVFIPVVQPFGSGTRRADERAWMLLAALPTVATLVYEWTTGDMPSNWMRFAAGLPLGVAVSWLVLAAPPRRRRASRVN
jgi:uncharacterized membrane protein